MHLTTIINTQAKAISMIVNTKKIGNTTRRTRNKNKSEG